MPKKVEVLRGAFISSTRPRHPMSVRIGQSILRRRKYDWIFCECINTQRSRALHVRTALDSSKGIRIGRVKTHVPEQDAQNTEVTTESRQLAAKDGTRKGRVAHGPFARPLIRRIGDHRASGGSTEDEASAEKVRTSEVPTSSESLAAQLRVIRTAATQRPKRLVRRLRSLRASLDSTEPAESAKEARSSRDDQDTPPEPLRIRRRRARGFRIVTDLSKSGTPVEHLSNNGSQPIRVASYRARELVNEQSQTVRFMKASSQPTTSFIAQEQPQDVQIRKLISNTVGPLICFTFLSASAAWERLSTRALKRRKLRYLQLQEKLKEEDTPRKPLRPYDPGPSREAKRIGLLASLALKAGRQLFKARGQHGFRKRIPEKPALFRKIFVETDPAAEYIQQHVLRNVTRPLVREVGCEKLAIRKVDTDSANTGETPLLRHVGLLKIRKHSSISTGDHKSEAVRERLLAGDSTQKPSEDESLEAMREPVSAEKSTRSLQPQVQRSPVLQPVKVRVIKISRPLVRRHIAALPVPHLRKYIVGPPDDELLLVPHATAGIQTNPAEVQPKGETLRAKSPFLIKAHASTPLYLHPGKKTKELFKGFLRPKSRTPLVELPPSPNLEVENPAERVNRTVASSSAKRAQREAWLARKGDLRLAISLQFKPGSMAGVDMLRTQYGPGPDKFGRFRILRRLDVGKYMEYSELLTKLTEKWEPFDLRLLKPGFYQEKSRFRVGFHLEFDKLEKLEQELLGRARELPGDVKADRRNTRDNDELGMMVISGKIKTHDEAIEMTHRLNNEHLEELFNIRVEGLALHGYYEHGDSLFPPPKEFLFSRETPVMPTAEWAAQKDFLLARGRPTRSRVTQSATV